ncbi:proline-rich proteoglycan 2-like isoform X3 [Lathamus discolor]
METQKSPRTFNSGARRAHQAADPGSSRRGAALLLLLLLPPRQGKKVTEKLPRGTRRTSLSRKRKLRLVPAASPRRPPLTTWRPPPSPHTPSRPPPPGSGAGSSHTTLLRPWPFPCTHRGGEGTQAKGGAGPWVLPRGEELPLHPWALRSVGERLLLTRAWPKASSPQGHPLSLPTPAWRRPLPLRGTGFPSPHRHGGGLFPSGAPAFPPQTGMAEASSPQGHPLSLPTPAWRRPPPPRAAGGPTSENAASAGPQRPCCPQQEAPSVNSPHGGRQEIDFHFLLARVQNPNCIWFTGVNQKQIGTSKFHGQGYKDKSTQRGTAITKTAPVPQ